jgi:two-component system, NtrC family, sensor kinase
VNELDMECVSAAAAHLAEQNETSLSRAYDLGRRALAQGMGILDIMSLQAAVYAQLVRAAPAHRQAALAAAVDDFFREMLSPFEMSFRGYREANGELLRLNRDLNEAYSALQAKQLQLIQAAKMASLGELVAGIAHEVNNPIAFVISHVGTALKCLERTERELGGAAPAGVLEQLTRAQDRLRESAIGARRIADLVLRLRTFSRLDEGERKPASISECVVSVLTILEHRHHGRVDIETHFGYPDVVDCFPSLLNQAIMNLVANAIDAVEPGGTIAINTGADGGSYVIVVTDNGHGIPEPLRQRVFEPFFTTKPVGQGTGLGLSISYSIVQAHGGSLDLAPRPGGGTVATIRFPLAPRSAPPRSELLKEPAR